MRPVGIAMAPDATHLAEQPALDVAAQLRAGRRRTRAREGLLPMAKPSSDADIDDLAAWFASLRLTSTD